MKQYIKPDASSILGFQNHPALSQYFLDDHSLTANQQGPVGCGFATDDHALFICVSGNEDASADLIGLTAISSLNVENTIISCSVGGPFVCSSGIGYTCQIGNPGFNTEQCITSLTDNNGHSIDCGVTCDLS